MSPRPHTRPDTVPADRGDSRAIALVRSARYVAERVAAEHGADAASAYAEHAEHVSRSALGDARVRAAMREHETIHGNHGPRQWVSLPFARAEHEGSGLRMPGRISLLAAASMYRALAPLVWDTGTGIAWERVRSAVSAWGRGDASDPAVQARAERDIRAFIGARPHGTRSRFARDVRVVRDNVLPGLRGAMAKREATARRTFADMRASSPALRSAEARADAKADAREASALASAERTRTLYGERASARASAERSADAGRGAIPLAWSPSRETIARAPRFIIGEDIAADAVVVSIGLSPIAPHVMRADAERAETDRAERVRVRCERERAEREQARVRAEKRALALFGAEVAAERSKRALAADALRLRALADAERAETDPAFAVRALPALALARALARSAANVTERDLAYAWIPLASDRRVVMTDNGWSHSYTSGERMRSACSRALRALAGLRSLIAPRWQSAGTNGDRSAPLQSRS